MNKPLIMKAYYLSLVDEDQGCFLVFAKTATKAKSFADSKDLMYDSYIDIRAIRAKKYDGLENISERDLNRILWRDGWQWLDYDSPDADDATDEQFNEWHDSIFGAPNNKGDK